MAADTSPVGHVLNRKAAKDMVGQTLQNVHLKADFLGVKKCVRRKDDDWGSKQELRLRLTTVAILLRIRWRPSAQPALIRLALGSRRFCEMRTRSLSCS